MKTTLLVASVTFNLVLLAAFVGLSRDRSAEPSSAADPSAVVPQLSATPGVACAQIPPLLPAASPGELVTQLREMRLPENWIAAIAHAELNQADLAPADAMPFWLQPRPGRVDAHRREVQQLEVRRTALIDLLGEGVQDSPALTRVFRPLDQVFPDLPAAKQQALQQSIAETTLMYEERRTPAHSPEDAMKAREIDQIVQRILSAEEYAEYSNRYMGF